MSDHESTPAGWYPEAEGRQLRWWDGSAWTDHVAPAPSPNAPAAVELVAERKRIYSHDVLYVTDSSGTKVGRINLDSGEVTMDRPEMRAEFDQFIERWRAHRAASEPPTAPPPAAPDVEPSP